MIGQFFTRAAVAALLMVVTGCASAPSVVDTECQVRVINRLEGAGPVIEPQVVELRPRMSPSWVGD